MHRPQRLHHANQRGHGALATLLQRLDRARGHTSTQRQLRLLKPLGQASRLQATGQFLRDFVGGDGQPGYFQQELFVYGRGGEFCKVCGSTLREIRLGQRASVYCPRCQR